MVQPAQQSAADDEAAVRALYRQLLDGWNAHSGAAYAAPFAEDGLAIGFDGSEHRTRAEIAATIQQIFDHHNTPRYVGKVRDVRFLGPDAAILLAISGLVPPGQDDINPNLNALHTVVAARNHDAWQIALFQNTPAQYHGWPELTEQLTVELRELL